MEEAGLVKKGPESRVIREGFLEEEDLNPGLERRQTWISRRERERAVQISGSSTYIPVRKWIFSCLENTIEDKPGLLENQISTLQFTLC